MSTIQVATARVNVRCSGRENQSRISKGLPSSKPLLKPNTSMKRASANEYQKVRNPWAPSEWPYVWRKCPALKRGRASMAVSRRERKSVEKRKGGRDKKHVRKYD